jgi:flagellar basal-body rod modification protein FlgD
MSAVSSLASNLDNPVKRTSRPDAFSSLSSGEFMKVIFAELNNQDPLQPNDTGKMLEQLASLRSIQADVDLQGKLDTLVTQNQLASASGLLGRRVSGLTEDNRRVNDEVTAVSKGESGPVLVTKQGWRVPFNKVDQMFAAATGQTGANANANTGTNTGTNNSTNTGANP